MLAVLGKLLIESSGITLLPLQVKEIHPTVNPLPTFTVTVPLHLRVTGAGRGARAILNVTNSLQVTSKSN
jgi:hypothetical protein